MSTSTRRETDANDGYARWGLLLLSCSLGGVLAACDAADSAYEQDGLPDEAEIGSNQEGPSFAEFLASVHKEPWPGGVYIVDGDTPVHSIEDLRAFYDRQYGSGALIVQTSRGTDAAWLGTEKQQLTYCISNAFGSNKQRVVDAIAAATADWTAAADVKFTYLPAEDARCTSSNNAVLFDVQLVTGEPYLARAFFPGDPRMFRNVMIDSSSFYSSWPLAGVLRHELGHTLGFRHEHTRPEAGHCFEDSDWRALTPYDAGSVMHYPQCNGRGNGQFELTAMDIQGVRALYGAPQTGRPQEPQQPEPQRPSRPVQPVQPVQPRTPGQGVQRHEIDEVAVQPGREVRYQVVRVVPGTRFDISMEGTGDADLYVRFGARPTTFSYDCRPFASDSTERCSLEVPRGVDTVYVMVHGYRAAAEVVVDARWTEPVGARLGLSL